MAKAKKVPRGIRMRTPRAEAPEKEPTNRDVYMYGTITDDKWHKSDFVPDDMRESVEDLGEGDVLNLYINSPGGSVFAMSAMVSMMKRAQQRGVTINSFVDGVAASAASVIALAADSVTMYSNSFLMIHKPWTVAVGNADDLVKEAETLEQIENATMMPVYRGKARVDDEKLKALVRAESWMDSEKAGETFDVSLEEEEKQAAAFDPALFNARNVPETLVASYKNQASKPAEPAEPVDLTEYINHIKAI